MALAERRASPHQISVPDPSVMTNAALRDMAEGMRSEFVAQVAVVNTRLSAVEKANEVFEERITRVPTDTDKQVGNLRVLHDREFDHLRAIYEKFRDRMDHELAQMERRYEMFGTARREAVAAEFGALKELIEARNKASETAIAKAEVSTTKQVQALADLRDSSAKAMDQKFTDLAKATDSRFADLTSRADRAEAMMSGIRQHQSDARLNLNGVLGIGGFVVAVMVGGLAFYNSSRIQAPAPYPPPYAQPYPQQQFPQQGGPPPVTVVPVVPVPVPNNR